MTDTLNLLTLRYLPVEVSGQLFVFPMTDVMAVGRMGDDRRAQDASGSVPSDEDTRLEVLDLRRFFGMTTDLAPSIQTVVLSTPLGTCALLVDAVRPVRTATSAEIYALPYLVDRLKCPFSGVINGAETPILIVDSRRLIERLQCVAPALVVGEGHAV